MSAARSEYHSGLGYSTSLSAAHTRSTSPTTGQSPVDPSGSSASAFPSLRSSHSGFPGTVNPPPGIMTSNSRSGAGSPSGDMGGSGRFFSKRAREIQAQEGISGLPMNPNAWIAPPTSGNSTPLRENIPESPTDSFPGLHHLPTPDTLPQTRRGRAGTVPSRFPLGPSGAPGASGHGLLGNQGLAPHSAQITPSQSPFNKSPSPNLDLPESTPSSSAVFARLRAGSMPQRSQFATALGTSSPFGPSIFSSSWNPSGPGRERGSTLASIASVGSNGPSSPAQSQLSKEGTSESDVHMRTLDYLGLAETPQPPRAQLATPNVYVPTYNQDNRGRSYSVNTKNKYEKEFDNGVDNGVDPISEEQYAAAAALQGQLQATQAAIRSHNIAVQMFADHASATRPRAQTMGILERSSNHRSAAPQLGARATTSVAHPAVDEQAQESHEYEGLPHAVAGMGLGSSSNGNVGLLHSDDQGNMGQTSAIWMGNLPTSTTTSTLTHMFRPFGTVVSVRVLTNKSCGFVNFEKVEQAVAAKASLNGKEIFPGGGPIRINFAKPVSASNTPGHEGPYPSPSPEPFTQNEPGATGANSTGPGDALGAAASPTNLPPTAPPLHELTADVMDIVSDFGATNEEGLVISAHLQSAIQYNAFNDEIPSIKEPSHTRIHDASRLRDIRKRIDNQALSQSEIEDIATDMLPEIAELSSDYLGNTVVQKLFEHCSDELRDDMLEKISPHLAEISVHKNGTWAAQKIIDVCKTPSQMSMIVEHLHPYTLPLFLDQYGNYVLQGCLKFGPPFHDFIFETMLSRMWDVAQGRYGARAMRACLESHHSSKNQQRMLAAVIALNSVQLATNANGALLLTWFLDTCTFAQRRTVLSRRLIPCLVHLCTHKVAYLTVLKVVNQKSEPEARDAILHSLFFTPNDQVLEAILRDQLCGATFTFKVLTTPFFDDSIRASVVQTVKNVLVKIKAQPNQGYKRLMDEVGLSTKTASSTRETNGQSEPRQRPNSRPAGTNGQQHGQGQYGNKQYYPVAPAGGPSYDMGYGSSQGEATDPNSSAFPPFNQGVMYNPSTSPMPPAMNMGQLQYQQNMMGRGGVPMGYNYPNMQPAYGGYEPQSAGMDQLRQQAMGSRGTMQAPMSPMAPTPVAPTAYAPPGFAMAVGGYPYGQMGGAMPSAGGYPPQEQMPPPRRGRRQHH